MNAKTLTKEPKNLKGILNKIAQGLHHLHLSRIQHRDLKLENILLNCGVPKITDF
jgi:serine/threonine protein kinase